MSKLDKFVSVKYQNNISQFSDVDYDTVVIISNTVVNETMGNDDTQPPAIFSSASGFPETLSVDTRNIGKRALEYGKKVIFWNTQLANYYCYLFMEYISSITEWKRDTASEQGYDQFIAVFPQILYDATEITKPSPESTIQREKYPQWLFASSDDSPAFESNFGSRIVVVGSGNKDKSNDLQLAASVAGVIAGGYRNFTTHLRQISPLLEDRQIMNPKENTPTGGQSDYIGSVVLAGNAFIEGSQTRGVYKKKDKTSSDTVQMGRKFIDRQVLEDRLVSRIQEECLKVMTYGDGIPFTQQGANMIAAAGAVALSEATALKIIDDFETSVNYDQVTTEDIEARRYDKLVYRFRFSGSIEYVEVVLEV